MQSVEKKTWYSFEGKGNQCRLCRRITLKELEGNGSSLPLPGIKRMQMGKAQYRNGRNNGSVALNVHGMVGRNAGKLTTKVPYRIAET